jgi:ankyrin repeat protein
MSANRRQFIAAGFAASAALVSVRAIADENSQPEAPAKTLPSEGKRRPRQDLLVVDEFVGAGHRDLDKVKEMVEQDPKLVFASRDLGGGDWETALEGASHMGRYDIVEFLLSKGARITACCSAMLGQRDVLIPLLAATPSVATTKGPHGLTLLYHAAIGGDVAIAEAIKPHLESNAVDFNQSLSAAARDGRLEMTSWLIKSGVTNVNAPDAFKKTPLTIALSKGFAEVADVLRVAGGRETL